MGRSPRPRPQRLATKLLEIRTQLGLTKESMLERLGYQQSPLHPHDISEFENGRREPPLPLLLRYARLSGIALEMLADDALDLPEFLPSQAQIPATSAQRSTLLNWNEPDGAAQLRLRAGQCPYCGAGNRQVKAGLNPTGSQRYLCRVCGRYYTPQAKPNSYPLKVRRQAIELYQQKGWGFSRIGKRLGVNPRTVANWIYAYYGRVAIENEKKTSGDAHPIYAQG